MSRPCDATTEIPTAVPSDPGIVQRTGYPDDCLARCCRIEGHDGKHFVALALASGPGSFSMSWSTPSDARVLTPESGA